YPWQEGMDAPDWLMRHDQNFYLPDCLMVKTDIASMANSLEVRCPFLDHQFVEFAATIPSQLKRDATGGKKIYEARSNRWCRQKFSINPKPGSVFQLPNGFAVILRLC
ncbi:MAG: asparagine synthase C-terminal domain-containing protein, partial [Methanosarcinaceae archaeon]|nr:asparagine synthase C-terminal domain-containing protein [Methanosarcinaceae archaeon]